MFMLIKFDRFPERGILPLEFEERGLTLGFAVSLPYRLDDRAGVYPFVDMKGYGRDLKGGMLGLSGPDELRIKVRVVGVGFLFFRWIVIRVHQTNWGVITPPVFMLILFDWFIIGCCCGSFSPSGHGKNEIRSAAWRSVS